MQLQPPTPTDVKTGYDAIVWIAFAMLGFSLVLNGWFLRSAADKLTDAIAHIADHETRISVVEEITAAQRDEIRRFWDRQVERGFGRREGDSL